MLTNFAERMEQTTDPDQEYLGHVVEVDPTGQGRFKIKVPGLYEEGDLPWVGFPRATSYGNGKDFGSFGSPKVGSVAIIRLQGGDPVYPICEGFVARAEDIPAMFRNSHTWGWQDVNGSYLIVDEQAQTFTFQHVKGVRLYLDANGNASINVPKSITTKCEDFNVNATRKINLISPETEVTGNLKVGGNTSVDGNVSSKKTVTGKDMNAQETLTINGADYRNHRHWLDDHTTTLGVVL